MPLVVDGSVVVDIPANLPDFFSKYPHFKVSSECLCTQEKQDIAAPGLLYVGQREYAATTPNDNTIKILGSDDATTCHIVVLRHTGSGAVCLAHCDGCETKKGVKDFVAAVLNLSHGNEDGRLELHLVGGFLDNRNSSRELSLELLSAFQEIPEEIHLVTACISDLNSTPKGNIQWPIIYGIACDVGTGQIIPATFKDKGPDMALRSARHFTGSHDILNIYDHHTGSLTVGPFDYKQLGGDIDMWLAVPDSIIRKHLSTSPEQEPAHFEKGVRAALKQIRDHPNPMTTMFAGGRPRRYKQEHDGSWRRLEDP